MQDPLAAHRVEVARGRRVEGHGAGEGARDDEPLHDVFGERVHEAARDRVEEGARVGGGVGRGGRQTVAEHGRPGGQRVEHAQADDRDVGGARHHLARVARLFGVVRGGLEADPRPQGEEDADAGSGDLDARAQQGRDGVQRGEADTRGAAALGEHEDVHDEQQEHLAHQGHAEQTGAQLDVEVGEDPDDGDAGEGIDRPGQVDVQERRERAAREVGEDAPLPGLEDRVGGHAAPAGRHAQGPAQPVADVAVEAAGGGELASHGDVAHREEEQQDGREDEAAGRRGAVTEADGDGHVAQHGRHGRGRGERQEEHAEQAEGVRLELLHVVAQGDVERFRGGAAPRRFRSGWLSGRTCAGHLVNPLASNRLRESCEMRVRAP